eukprot:RCo039040
MPSGLPLWCWAMAVTWVLVAPCGRVVGVLDSPGGGAPLPAVSMLTSGTRMGYLFATIRSLLFSGGLETDLHLVLCPVYPFTVKTPPPPPDTTSLSQAVARVFPGRPIVVLPANFSVLPKNLLAPFRKAGLAHSKAHSPWRSLRRITLGVAVMSSLRVARPGQGVLVIEDDVEVCPYFWPLLLGLVRVVEQRERHYVLILYTAYN